MRATSARRLRPLAPALAALLAACATITYDAVTVERMVAMNRTLDPDRYDVVGRFEVRQRPIFAAAELITVRDAELTEALRRELARTGGDAVINLRIEEHAGALDFLIGLVAGALVSTRTVEYEGDIIRFRGAGPGPGGDAALEAVGCERLELRSGAAPARVAWVCAEAVVGG